MSKEINSQMYPFKNEGKLCPILDNADFLVEAYTASGYRPSIKAFCKKVGLPYVPIVFTGRYSDLDISRIFKSKSILSSSQKVMEGLVLEEVVEKNCFIGRKKVKIINPEYLLLKGNTDYH